jgi:hypothetical protein
MTEQDETMNNNDTKPSAKSPNDRKKKTSREGFNKEDGKTMDAEIEKQEPRNIFGNEESSSIDDITLHDNIPEANQDNDEDHVDFADANEDINDNDMAESNKSDTKVTIQIPPTPTTPYLSKLDLADKPFWLLPIAIATDLWSRNHDWACEVPYTTIKLDGKKYEYEESLEYHIQIGQIFTSEPTDATTIDSWIQVMAYALDVGEQTNPTVDAGTYHELKIIRRMAVRLALSDPVELFPSSSWKNGELNPDLQSHRVWTASYLIFGAPWKTRENWFATPPPALPTSLKRKTVKRSNSSKSVEFVSTPTRAEKTLVSSSRHKPKPNDTDSSQTTPNEPTATSIPNLSNPSMYLTKAL